MIDWARVIELRDEIGEHDFQEVVDLFLEEVEETLDRLMSETEAGALEATMHFLKGSALNLGFSDFSKLCQAGETAAGSGDGAAIDKETVMKLYSTSKSEFMKEMQQRFAA